MAENLPDTNVGNIEYTSKEDASDAVIKHLQLDYEYAWGVREAINSLPSADVVQVVRCRKCKYFRTYRCMDSMPIETCELAQTFYNPDLDFCSLAKCREE